MLEEALGQLPAEQRAVFVLRAFEELSYKEIAEALGHRGGHGDEPAVPGAREAARALCAGYLGPALDRAGGASR